jgi:hypothetical protein
LRSLGTPRHHIARPVNVHTRSRERIVRQTWTVARMVGHSRMTMLPECFPQLKETGH